MNIDIYSMYVACSMYYNQAYRAMGRLCWAIQYDLITPESYIYKYKFKQ